MNDNPDDPYAATLARHALEFLDDAEDYVEQLWLLSSQPSTKKSEKVERLAAFRRIVHTLKGQGSSFGFTSITILSHRLEDYLDSHQEPEKWADGGVDMFLRAIDKIVAARVEPSESVFQTLLDKLPSSSTKKQAEITILLVSGAKVIRHKIRRDLEYYGFRVITVSDAYDGLRYASRAQPSAVVWSATLDGTNGFEMIAAMEAMDSTQEIPNVLLTSFDLTHERILALPRYIPVVKLGSDTSKFIAKALTALELKESDPERVIRPLLIDLSTGGNELTDGKLAEGGITVIWDDGVSSHFHALWLRDNCRCPLCGEHETGRRISRVADFDPDLLVHRVDADGDTLSLVWSDGHKGSFTGSWLRRHAYDDMSRKSLARNCRAWGDDFRNAPPVIEASAVATDNDAFLEVLHQVRDNGLCFLRDAGDAPGPIEALANRIGPMQESNFGLIQDLIYEPGGKVAQSTVALRPHTDEPYRASPPGILLFHCIQNDVTGAGASLFADGFEIAQALREEDEEAFDALCTFPQAFRRFYEDDVDLTVSFPVISVDEFGNIIGVRINDRVSAPLSIPPDQVPVYYRGKRRLAQLSEDPRFVLKKTLRPGDIAIFDNHRVLHGRTELTPTGRRWLQWVQVERGDLHSKIRIVSDRLGLARGVTPEMRGAYG